MLEKTLCLALSLLLILSLAACNNGTAPQDGNKIYKAELKVGSPLAPGDVFSAPESGSGSSVTLAQATTQANPDDSVIVMGEGFKGKDVKAYVYSQSTSDNAKASLASFTATEDQTAMVTIDKSLPYGIYGVYFEASGNRSNVLYINRPKIWWIGITRLCAGESLEIFGENLTTDNKDKAYVYLLSNGKYCELKVQSADPYKITAIIPEGLDEKSEYEVLIHNGHGGNLGFAKAQEKITYSKEPFTPFSGKRIDVTDHGAKPTDDADDTAAVQAAIDAASDGDTIYFPIGKYNFTKSLEAYKSLKFEGVRQNGNVKSTLVLSRDFKGDLIECGVGPTEITSLNFWDVRQTKLENSFIHFDGDSLMSPGYNIYIHHCNFTQQSNPQWDSVNAAIKIERTTQAIIEDNDFRTTQLGFYNYSEKVYLRRNTYTSTFNINTFMINDNANLFWSTNCVDASKNEFYSRNNSTEEAVPINRTSYTNGRSFALQNYTNNYYISHNKIVGCGLPNSNGGEQIMYENGGPEYMGALLPVDKSSVKISSGYMPSAGDLLTFSDGKGKGQTRIVKGYKNGNIILNEPLNIEPDSTTFAQIIHLSGYNAAIHKNKMIGYTNYYNDWCASCGVQIYWNNVNFFITDNEFSYMCYGVCVTPRAATDIPASNAPISATYWINIDNNNIFEVDTGIRYNAEAQVEQKWESGFGVAIRRNKFKNPFPFAGGREEYIGGDGIAIGHAEFAGTYLGDWVNSTLIENNEFINCPTADITFYPRQSKTVLRGNRTDKGDKLDIKLFSGAEGSIEF